MEPELQGMPQVEDFQQRIQCDSCSARATTLVLLPYGELAFCSHHYNKNTKALTDAGGIAKLLGVSEDRSENHAS